MAYSRLSMRRVKEILRLKFEAGLSQRAIARSIGVSNSTISEVFSRLALAGLTWPLPEGIGDAELERRLYHEILKLDLLGGAILGAKDAEQSTKRHVEECGEHDRDSATHGRLGARSLPTSPMCSLPKHAATPFRCSPEPTGT